MAIIKNTDSTAWRNKVEGMIARGTNVQEDSLVRVTLDEFKQLDHKKANGKESCVNEFIKHIERVIPASTLLEDAVGYDIYMDDGVNILILSDGRLKRGKNGQQISSAVGVMDSGHLRTTVAYPRQTTIFLERLMMIAHCVYNDCLPSSFDGVSCNVLDSSGSVNNIFGAEYNIRPDNLELCTVSMNSKAYQTAVQLHKLTGKLYKVSAYDVVLHDAAFQRPVDDILWYIKRTGIQEVERQK